MIAAAGWLLFVIAVVLLAWARNDREQEYQRGVLAGQRQAELAHGWHQPVDGDTNPAAVPEPRRRSPNRQPRAEMQPEPFRRSVFYD